MVSVFPHIIASFIESHDTSVLIHSLFFALSLFSLSSYSLPLNISLHHSLFLSLFLFYLRTQLKAAHDCSERNEVSLRCPSSGGRITSNSGQGGEGERGRREEEGEQQAHHHSQRSPSSPALRLKSICFLKKANANTS